MAISDLDRNRTQPLSPATVDRLARSYHDLGSQYAIFAESRAVSEKSINQFLDTAAALSKLRDPSFRADTEGMFQSLVSLWQILVRQQSIPESRADDVLFAIVSSFAQVHGNRELFDAGRDNTRRLLAATVAAPGLETPPHERLSQLLAGGVATGTDAADFEAHEQMLQDIQRVLEAQRIVSLDALFDLSDNLEGLSKSEKANSASINKITSRISEIQLPRRSLSPTEMSVLGFGYWPERHIDYERKLNIRAAIEKAGSDPEKLKDVCGLIAPLLRDSLVAFSYAYYAPPGAQILYTNPVFVRSHDFLGVQENAGIWRSTELSGTGWPANSGGRLVGSLATLPYALAQAEQNFLVPAQTQALIWGDLVPQMILSAKIPRWWSVTPSQVHWVGLHLRYARELLAEAALDPKLRQEVVDSLAMAAAPMQMGEVRRLVAQGLVKEALDVVTPSELFWLARDLASNQTGDPSPLLAELRKMPEASPQELNYTAISHAFGTPKPTLANSYEPELLGLRTFPALMGYSSRILAESWESNTLYWVALADELSLPPAELNLRIPEWTQRLVEEIFASHLEDWPALLKSLRQVGDEVRSQSRASAGSEQKAELREIGNW